MAVSKKAASSKAAPKADAGHSHDEANAKIASLEKKVADLESKLAGVLASVEALAQVKGDLDEAKTKISAEVSELKEKAKSWKEKADTNNDGKLDFEEIYSYVFRRWNSRSKRPRK